MNKVIDIKTRDRIERTIIDEDLSLIHDLIKSGRIDEIVGVVRCDGKYYAVGNTTNYIKDFKKLMEDRCDKVRFDPKKDI